MKLLNKIRNMQPMWHVTLYALAAYVLMFGTGLRGALLSVVLAAAGAVYQVRQRRHGDKDHKA